MFYVKPLHILRSNCLLAQRLEKKTYQERQKGWEDEEEDVRSYWITLGKYWGTGSWKISNTSNSLKNLLWKWLWTCHKRDCVIGWFDWLIDLPIDRLIDWLIYKTCRFTAMFGWSCYRSISWARRIQHILIYFIYRALIRSITYK